MWVENRKRAEEEEDGDSSERIKIDESKDAKSLWTPELTFISFKAATETRRR